MTRFVPAVLVAVLVAVLAVAFALTDVGPLAAQAKKGLTFQQALQQAQQAHPGAILIRGRVEMGGRIFGFYFFLEGRITEYELDLNGTVVKNVTTDPASGTAGGQIGGVSGDVVALLGKSTKEKAKLPDGRLLELAGEALKDAPIKEMKYDIQDGKLVTKFGTLVLDAQTGKPVEKK